MPFRRLITKILIGLLLSVGTSWASADPSSAFFDGNGVKLHYVQEGKGEPIILLHGLYASANMNWQKPGIFSWLAKDHEVIALDLPGHGESDKPDNAAAYGVQMANDVALLMDHLHIAKANIVGYSLGGLIAFRFIADHPERVLSGTLGGMGWMQAGSSQQHRWEQMDPGITISSTPSVCVNSMGKLALTKDQVLSIKVPMEIIVGDRDPVLKNYVVRLHALRPDWPIIQIKGAGHISCVTKPQFQDELTRWIDAK